MFFIFSFSFVVSLHLPRTKMKHFTPLALLFLLADTTCAADLDSLLSAQRTRAGVRADTVFSALDNAKATEKEDACFLLAYLPLADLAYMTGDDILENVRLAQKARAEFAWGSQLTNELYTHFVLPHRVSQEPFVRWRKQFYETLAPRVIDMTMTEAALEVNHWCHEVATYKPSDSRDQDPLTTIRAGLGRCEEEMILAICALRSVGIPARQCYTPFWAHMDDNHAWVEVWADGKWHYFGACEPEVALNRAWFTNAAKRAMLVASTAYGDYHGSEPVLKRYGNATLINSTAVYGTTREVHITLLDADGRLAANQKLYFNLYNYGSFLPAMVLETDENGMLNIVCGPGDWFVTAGDGENATFAHLKSNATQAMLRLGKPKLLRGIKEADYNPPPEALASEEIKRDSLFACRLTNEDSIREANVWSTWIRENNLDTVAAHGSATYVTRPDSAWVYAQTDSFLPDSTQQKLLEILRKARGNWGNFWNFVCDVFPGERIQHQYLRKPEFALLTVLDEKDLRDFSQVALNDHLTRVPSSDLHIRGRTEHEAKLNRWGDSLRSDPMQRDYVFKPRLSYEPARPWYIPLAKESMQLRTREVAITDSSYSTKSFLDPQLLRSWLLSNITVEDPKDRLGPPLTPAECLLLRRGAQDDLERLYLGFMRVNGVPARFNPATMKPEIWQDGTWQIVELGKSKTKNEKLKNPRTGKLVIRTAVDSAQYNKTWAVAMWDKDHFSDLDFGYMEPFKNIKWPHDLPAGLYCLTTGVRRKDGSVPISATWFEIKPGKTTKVELKWRDNGENSGL